MRSHGDLHGPTSRTDDIATAEAVQLETHLFIDSGDRKILTKIFIS